MPTQNCKMKAGAMGGAPERVTRLCEILSPRNDIFCSSTRVLPDAVQTSKPGKGDGRVPAGTDADVDPYLRVLSPEMEHMVAPVELEASLLLSNAGQLIKLSRLSITEVSRSCLLSSSKCFARAFVGFTQKETGQSFNCERLFSH